MIDADMSVRTVLLTLAIFVGGVAAGFALRAWGWEEAADQTPVSNQRAVAEIVAKEIAGSCLSAGTSCRVGELKQYADQVWGLTIVGDDGAVCWTVHLDEYARPADLTAVPAGVARISCYDF
jgi:hypothetical protein